MSALAIGDRVRGVVNCQGISPGAIYIVEQFTPDGELTALRPFGTNRLIAVREAEGYVEKLEREVPLPERCACGLFCMSGGERREAPTEHPPGSRSDHHPDGCVAFLTTGQSFARHDRGGRKWRKVGGAR